jgi:hypothetical protein
VAALAQILTARQPFGPRDAEGLVEDRSPGTEQLFDRKNLIYAQTTSNARPAYIIGRKGAGKTAFLRSSALCGEREQEVLGTATVYAEMASLLAHYKRARSPLFAQQAALIWDALFDHVALFHAYNTAATEDSASDLQIVWDYLAAPPYCPSDATSVAERFLSEFQHRISDDSLRGLTDIIDGLTRGGVSFARARDACRRLLGTRGRPLVIVMDNLEDLHSRIFELEEVLAGLFHAVGRTADTSRGSPFGLQLCLPSELWEQIHQVSANPEKDFGGNYLTIYWTAHELLHLAGTRYRLFLQAHFPDRLDRLLRTLPGPADRDIDLLRAALPATIRNELGDEEDPLAFLLRHTQLLPRHLIEILNNVFGARMPGSRPWAVTEEAVLAGTQIGERVIIEGIFAAHRLSFPAAPAALRRMANRLDICFPARELRVLFNREGITKATGHDFDHFAELLLTLGVVGVKTKRTSRYNVAQFQYTFDSPLNMREDTDELCFHPIFTRHLLERSLDRFRAEDQRPTYPYGSSSADNDYRVRLGYANPGYLRSVR